MKTSKHAPHHPKHAPHPEPHDEHLTPEEHHIFIPPLKPGDPGPEVIKKIKPPYVAIFLPKKKSPVPLKSVSNPAPKKSFGYVNRFVRVTGPFSKGTLAVQIDAKDLGFVAAQTLRVFRWNDKTYTFGLVHRSDQGQTRDYVWAEITEPGIYAVIGVNAEPLVSRTLALLRSMQGMLSHLGPARKNFQKRICELLLCNPNLHKRMNDAGFARRFVEENLRLGLPSNWKGGVPPRISKKDRSELCKICISLGNPSMPPELEILSMALSQTTAEVGEWNVLSLGSQILAVHAALLRNGKVLYFSGSEHDQDQNELPAVDHSRLWNPNNNTIQTVGSPTHDLFCCGHAFLPNGKLVAAGGTQKWMNAPDPLHPTHFCGLRDTTIFDPNAPLATPWTAAAPMNFERGKTVGGGRWYPTLVTLPNGKLFTMSGHPEKSDSRHKNIMVEVFNLNPAPLGTWTDLGDQTSTPQNYARLHVLPDGKVFCATHTAGKSKKCDPSTGVWTNVCPGPGSQYASFETSSVLLPLLPSQNHKARVMVLGDVQPKIVDLSVSPTSWQNTSLRQPPSPVRRHGCAVLLPDASVLVVGGSETNLDADAVLAAERYDPASDTWSTLASASVERVYHTVALLLPNGKVWVCGSNFDSLSGIANRELRMEEFKPPYLYWGPKPVISSAPASITLPVTFVIQTPQANSIESVALLRCGSVTHAFDSDQRYVGLHIKSNTATSLTVDSPPNKNIAPPGYYLLFLLDANGVPSLGKFILVK